MGFMPPEYLDCVVAVGIKKGDSMAWVGTGFLYGQFVKAEDPKTNVYQAYLVTNRRVVEGNPEIFIRFNPLGIDDEGSNHAVSEYAVEAANIWTSHPHEAVDVAVTALHGAKLYQHKLKYVCFGSQKHVCALNDLKQLSASEGDPVFVLGYPMATVPEERHYVVCHSGVIARIRDCYERKTRDFLIDVPLFPGNRGGPVILRGEGAVGPGGKPGRGAMLIGIAAASIHYRETLVNTQTGTTRFVSRENSGLTAVIPVDYIQETIALHSRQLVRKT